jgi:hypothetical protein
MLGVGIIFLDSCVVNDFFAQVDGSSGEGANQHSFDTVYGATCSMEHNP